LVSQLYHDHTVDVWGSGAVHGNLSTMAPDSRKLVAAGHQHLVGAAVSPASFGYRRPILLVDRDGTVSMWETFGVRLGDPLPPDDKHREVIAIESIPWGDEGFLVATASRVDSNLRLWDPVDGTVTLIALDVRPRCLLAAGDVLVIGHDEGVLGTTCHAS